MDGIELAIRFSYITTHLRYCGPKEAEDHFMEYVKHKKDPDAVQASLKKFEGLYPYLSAIAEKNHKQFTDYDVVEAYWIGNSLLDTFTDEDIKKIIEHLTKRGLPKNIGTELIEQLPHGFVPHHFFNVIYVGVGKTTGSVETTLQNMDNCRPSWGRVVEVFNDKVIVKTKPLLFKHNKYFLGEEETKTAVYLPAMLPDVKNGDIVALHWGFAPVVLTKKQVGQMEHYSQKILDVMNGFLAAKD